MPSAEIQGVQPYLVIATSPLSVVLQNTGSETIYISGDSTVAANAQNLFIAPNVSFDWPANTPLWAICTIGASSTLAYSPNGAHIGAASPNSLITDPQYLYAPNPNNLYVSLTPQVAGVYDMTSPTGTVGTIKFYSNAGALIATGTTSAGVGSVYVTSNATYITYSTDTGTAVTLTLTLAGERLPYYAGNFILDFSALDGENTLV